MKFVAVCTTESRQSVQELIKHLADDDIHDVFVLVNPTDSGADIETPEGLVKVPQPATDNTGRAAAKGAATGAAIGGATAVAGLFVPFLWPILLVTAPVAVGLGAAAGAVVNAAAASSESPGALQSLAHFEIPDSQMEPYRDALNRGEFFVAVKTDDELLSERASALFENYAENVRVFIPGRPVESDESGAVQT